MRTTASGTDARIPVVFGADVTPGDAQLREGRGSPGPNLEWFIVSTAGAPNPGHEIGCACCTPRGAAGLALTRLALASARGEAPLFRRVVACTQSTEGRAAVLRALDADPVAAGRFRLAE